MKFLYDHVQPTGYSDILLTTVHSQELDRGHVTVCSSLPWGGRCRRHLHPCTQWCTHRPAHRLCLTAVSSQCLNNTAQRAKLNHNPRITSKIVTETGTTCQKSEQHIAAYIQHVQTAETSIEIPQNYYTLASIITFADITQPR